MDRRTFRKRVAQCLATDTSGDAMSRVVDLFLITLISLNVMAIILESVPAVMEQHSNTLYQFELFSVAVFSVEYALRLWSSPELGDARFAHPVLGRARFSLTPFAIIDLLAIAPFYLGFLVGMDLRFLRVVRLVRIFKLTRYSTTMQLILNVFRAEASTFAAAFALMLILLVLASSGIYLLENDVQPEVFGSIPAAMWWAMATLTTVGYGDAIPISPVGKFFGGCITLIGVGMVALPAGILASSFSEQLRMHREQWQDRLATAMEDGHVDGAEMQQLDTLRQRLGMSATDTDLLYRAFLREHGSDQTTCPHCDGALLDHDPHLSGAGTTPHQ
jgi:voltage-gated potassium channel